MSNPTLDTHKAALQAVHNAVLGRNADSKTLSYWANCLANRLKTIEDFEHALLNGADYRVHLAKAFKEAYCDHIISDVDDEEVARFVDKHAGTRIAEGELFKHVANMQQFEDKYVKLINSLYSLHKGQSCSIDVAQHYLRKLRADARYDVNQLSADILNDSHLRGDDERVMDAAGGYNADAAAATGEGATSGGNSYVDAFVRAYGRQPTEADFLEQRSVLTVQVALDKEAVADFESAFGRQMYVHEYFKYVLEREVDEDVEDYPNWHALFHQHMSNYGRMREIYKSYTGSDLSEAAYVSKYLYDVEKPGFFDTIVDGIVASREYEANMKDLLVNKFMGMHDEALEEHDAAYLFSVVKQRKLGMNDDAIVRVLDAYKEEMDTITQHIFQQYVDVLERQPDINEVEREIAFYRERLPTPLCVDGIGAIDQALEEKLMRSLSYHDVVKDRIRLLFRSKQGKDVLPSILFEVLQRVLAEVTGNMRAADLDATIVRVAGLWSS